MQLADAKVLLPCQDYTWEFPSVDKVVVEQKSSGMFLAHLC